ncbi:MAG: hypothetical protein QXL43_04325, partial [Methanolinea sp.]
MRYYPDPGRNIDISRANRVIEEAFAEHGHGRVQMPPKIYVTLEKGDFRTMPGYIPSLRIAGVKIVNVHPGNPALGLPTVMALTIILDLETGRPVSVFNATELTDIRTGAAGVSGEGGVRGVTGRESPAPISSEGSYTPADVRHLSWLAPVSGR